LQGPPRLRCLCVVCQVGVSIRHMALPGAVHAGRDQRGVLQEQ
jgi:hypothetical protein